ncbi:hypothetical protein ACI797_14760 [Geodermatophilus sp. SYSU D00691]
MTAAAEPPSLLLHTVENLAEFHREHEKFYAAAPREQAVVLQRHASTLHAVADRTAAELAGVLFLEGQGAPPGLAALRREVRTLGVEDVATGEWMTKAMQAAWTTAAALLDIAPLDDLLGERHRIVANDWQAAGATVVAGRLLERAADVLDRLDPGADGDPPAAGRTPPLLHSAAELIARAADLLGESAGLVQDNERRWRVFHDRVAALLAVPPPAEPPAEVS